MNEKGEVVNSATLGESFMYYKNQAECKTRVNNVVSGLATWWFYWVVQQSMDDMDNPEVEWLSPTGSKGTLVAEYSDIREDRIIIYGTATQQVQEFVCKLKATNSEYSLYRQHLKLCMTGKYKH